jgi:5-methylcytosine-specific restriction protein B
MWTETELAFRRRRYDQLREEWEAAGGIERLEKKTAERDALRPEVNSFITDFLDGRSDAEGLRASIDSWGRIHSTFGFGGPAGAMVLNQLVKDSNGTEVDDLLRSVLPVPSDAQDAIDKIDKVADFIAEIRTRGSGAAIGRAAFFTSWFWWVQDPSFEASFPKAGRVLVDMEWLDAEPRSEGLRHNAYVDLLSALDDDVRRAGEVFWWLRAPDSDGNIPFVGIDETLPDRCRRVYELPFTPQGEDDALWQENHVNVCVILAELRRVGNIGVELLNQLGFDAVAKRSQPYWVIQQRHLRGSSWVSWRFRTGNAPAPGIRLHVDANGFQISLNAERHVNPKGFVSYFRRHFSTQLPPGTVRMRFDRAEAGHDVLIEAEPDARWGDVGVPLSVAELGTGKGLINTLTQHLGQFAPEAMRMADMHLEGDSEPNRSESIGMEQPLSALLDKFRVDSGYPNSSDRSHITAGNEFRALLQRDRLAAMTKAEFRRIYNQSYGSPGPQANLNRTIRDADEREWERILDTVDFLLWDDTIPTAERIDLVLDGVDRRVTGLGQAVIMKLLAITNDDMSCLVYPFSGDRGKAAVLERLGRPLPARSGSTGQRQVDAIDAIRQVTGVLELDPWEEMRFLYWLLDAATLDDQIEGSIEEEVPDDLDQGLTEAAEDLYIDVEFLRGIHRLLSRHRQVVFYGPPGTGKTFIAQRLARIVAPEDEQRRLVQFHPSTSYEDFVEGFRPVVHDNQLTYELQSGPLRDLADAAAADPQRTYVLIIDEINRANLPKVLGELLFLLEYRNESVRPLYRPDDEFSLPENLWIVGTMNTADRSVALLDAALRRRFQFVDFSPDVRGESPISQVLKNWVEREGELAILPEIVDALNNRLHRELGGDHLAFGPSFFMRRGITEEDLRDIWRYQVEPLVADLFFGDPQRAKQFALDEILSELGPVAIDGDPPAEL